MGTNRILNPSNELMSTLCSSNLLLSLSFIFVLFYIFLNEIKKLRYLQEQIYVFLLFRTKFDFESNSIYVVLQHAKFDLSEKTI